MKTMKSTFLVFIVGFCQIFYSYRVCKTYSCLLRRPLFAEMQILLHGTKNAYTTLRTNDVVFFKMTPPNATEEVISLGVFTSDKTILPLCSFDENSNKYDIDPFETPLSAEELKKEQKLLRVVSSDRIGQTYVIEEYIDGDTYIPIRSRNQPTEINNSPIVIHSQSTSTVSTIPTIPTEIDIDQEIEILKAQIELQSLKVNLLQLNYQRNKNQINRKIIETTKAPRPVGPYSQAIINNGLVYVSGCVGLCPISNKLVDGGILNEAKQSFANLKKILEESGSSPDHILKLTIMLQDLNQFSVVNNLCKEFFSEKSGYPARSTFQVAALPLGAQIEVDAVATMK